jgi:NADH:ubiquinone reductase (non-electrogenic)
MPRALRTLGRLVKYSVGIGGGLFLGDILINDEFDSSVTNRFRQRISAEQRAMEPRPRVLILGAGWGGLSMVRKLHTDKFDVTLVNPKNYFLFTPLLASTTTGRTSKSSIIEPVRHFCKRADAEDVRFIESEAVSVNLESQTVTCRDISDMHTSNDSFDVPYDYLVIGVGAEPATFGTPGVKEHAVFLKQIEHSRVIRSRILDALETACIPGQSDAEIERLLSFVVVGGGPTGVEYAGELADFLKRDAKRAYPPDIASRCSIRIVEGLPHVLARFEPQTIEYAEKQLKKENVILECDQFVKRVEAGKLTLSHRVTKESSTVPFGVLVWVTGIAAQPLVKDLIAAIGKSTPANAPLQEHTV